MSKNFYTYLALRGILFDGCDLLLKQVLYHCNRKSIKRRTLNFHANVPPAKIVQKNNHIFISTLWGFDIVQVSSILKHLRYTHICWWDYFLILSLSSCAESHALNRIFYPVTKFSSKLLSGWQFVQYAYLSKE